MTFSPSNQPDSTSNGVGALHTLDTYDTAIPTNVEGCGLSIAYQSDVFKLQPEDFTVISTNYTCPWKKNVEFQIPEDLPACPEGGCHCAWGWIHSQLSGGEQMYMIGYRVSVLAAQSGAIETEKSMLNDYELFSTNPLFIYLV